MNLALLLAGVRVWHGSPVEQITRLFLAVAILSLEMQMVTWTGVATLQSLPLVNAFVATALWLVARRRGDDGGWERLRPPVAAAALAVVVLTLNAKLPVTAADPYHLDRAGRIERLGTIAYDPTADSKLNVLGWLYELVLADLGSIPVVGAAAVKLHGLMGLILFVVAVGAVLEMLRVSSRLAWLLLLTVPVVFHQFVLVKNDLFGAAPALVVLTWLVVRVRDAPPLEAAWAAWLCGMAVGMKLTSFPLIVVAAGAVAFERLREPRILAAAAIGAAAGAISGGLLFTLVENARTYGDAVDPFGSLGNRTTGPGDAAASVGRFLISLVDLGFITRSWWPGRGGWGGTYGLALIWALAALVYARALPWPRRALVLAAVYWLAFAAVYPDADVAHRLALAPALMVTAVAAALVDDDSGRVPALWRRAGMIVVVVSTLQIARSAALYIARA